MVWAILATFLTRKPPVVQAAVVGLCVGLFVTTAAEANERNPTISSTVWLVLAWGLGAGVIFFAGLIYQRRNGWVPSNPGPRWLYLIYAGVWLFGIITAVMALLDDGGFKVAVLAVVPLVLLAPSAMQGVRSILGRATPEPDAAEPQNDK